MPSLAHRPLPSAPTRRTAVAAPAARLKAHEPHDALDADRIDFDAWLLAPAPIGTGERLVRFASQASGPVVLLIAAAGVLAAFA